MKMSFIGRRILIEARMSPADRWYDTSSNTDCLSLVAALNDLCEFSIANVKGVSGSESIDPVWDGWM
jgi:hypothetical protein